ncbi:hypothetical protein EJ03DRAFT_59044, partial [Teratosphaeria nubilosa]
ITLCALCNANWTSRYLGIYKPLYALYIYQQENQISALPLHSHHHQLACNQQFQAITQDTHKLSTTTTTTTTTAAAAATTNYNHNSSSKLLAGLIDLHHRHSMTFCIPTLSNQTHLLGMSMSSARMCGCCTTVQMPWGTCAKYGQNISNSCGVKNGLRSSDMCKICRQNISDCCCAVKNRPQSSRHMQNLPPEHLRLLLRG